jgi:cyclic pyranopterin monophosphate synthase
VSNKKLESDGAAIPAELTHIDHLGQAKMVDVGAKSLSERRAIAESIIRLNGETCRQLFSGELPKGEALAVARIAGIQAAKETSRLIPLCHTLSLSHASVAFSRLGEDALRITATASTVSGTGVEMEAMTAASIAALTIYDMVKARCRDACIERVQLLHKSGGKSGVFDRGSLAEKSGS